MRVGQIGRAVVRLMKSRETIGLLLELGRQDPAFALCDNPSCADCVGQRAAIRKRAWDREPFEGEARRVDLPLLFWSFRYNAHFCFIVRPFIFIYFFGNPGILINSILYGTRGI